MTERRFNEAEVAAIFERATETQPAGQRQLGSGQGMTLAQIQEIGREVGIAPEMIAHAAQVVDQRGLPTSRTLLGLPIGVGRTVDLDRRLSDDEWERLVVDLRETFDARGTVRDQGSLRQWTNGNLQALLEPMATGHRVRLRTIKGDARSRLIGGLGLIGVAAAGLIAGIAATGATDAGLLTTMGMIATMGAGLFGSGVLGLPRWARLRRQQMEDVAARLALMAKSPPDR